MRVAIREIAPAHHRRYGYRRFVITTDSRHDLEVYLNLAKRMKLTGLNQLWFADLTYIRLKNEFVCLAVIPDQGSRRTAGGARDGTLAARLAVRALEMSVPEKHHIVPGMSRPANPHDNPTCESFMKTLRQEEIYCRDYNDPEDLEKHLAEFLDNDYNRQRLHSALGYRTPAEFEPECGAPDPEAATDAPKMSFFRLGKSIDPISEQETSGDSGSDPHPLLKTQVRSG